MKIFSLNSFSVDNWVFNRIRFFLLKSVCFQQKNSVEKWSDEKSKHFWIFAPNMKNFRQIPTFFGLDIPMLGLVGIIVLVLNAPILLYGTCFLAGLYLPWHIMARDTHEALQCSARGEDHGAKWEMQSGQGVQPRKENGDMRHCSWHFRI